MKKKFEPKGFYKSNITKHMDVLSTGGIGELKSVDHGRSRDSRCLSRRQGQIFSAIAKDWLHTVFAGNVRRMRAGS